MRSKEESELIKSIQGKLTEIKDEWISKNARGENSLNVLTVAQILDYATEGLTEWNFDIEEQWREEVNTFDKGTNQWTFDGYVYHVKGALTIEGVGRRSQFGSKIAVGGTSNQNSAYKSAASDCLKKCASLFGVGKALYAEVQLPQETVQQVTQPVYQETQQVAQQEPQMIYHENGVVQQGQWYYVNNQWISEQEYYQWMQAQQQPAVQQIAQDTGWPPDPDAYYVTPEAVEETRQQYEQHAQQAGDNIPFNEGAPTTGGFEGVPLNEEPPPMKGDVQPQDFKAESQYSATQLPPGTPNQFKAEPVKGSEPVPADTQPQEKVDPLAHVTAHNPWDTPENMQQLETFATHKARLNIKQDSDLLPHIRDFFKDENAGLGSVTPESLVPFNQYLENLSA